MQKFCTLFNSYYLSRGLAMYYSLRSQASDFHLYIFAFDEPSRIILTDMNLAHVTVVALSEFETEELLAVKAERTQGEYCWTCTSSTIWHCIHTYGLDHCTYLDADLLFFSDPKVLTDEMGENSVLITSHRYSPQYDQAALSGIYCVQFVTFKNTELGLTALDWWRKACLTWCFNRFEDGKFGDQKYLDDWTIRFQGVHVLKHLGGGVAPWNSKDYIYGHTDGKILLSDGNSPMMPLVFYHFHDFRYCINESFRFTAEQYFLKSDVISLIYLPYVRALQTAGELIRLADKNAVFHESLYPLQWIKISLARYIRFTLTGSYKNYFKKSKI